MLESFSPFAMSHVRQGLLKLRPHNQKMTVRGQGENDGPGELTTTGKPIAYNPEHRNTGTPEHRNTGTPEHRNTGTPEHPGSLRLATANLLLGLRGRKNGVSSHSVSSGGRGGSVAMVTLQTDVGFGRMMPESFSPFAMSHVAMSHVRQGLLNLRPHNQKMTVRSQGENDGLGELTTTGKPISYNSEHWTPEHPGSLRLATANLLLGLVLMAGSATEAQAAPASLIMTAPPDALEGSTGTSDRYFDVRLAHTALSRILPATRVDFTVCFNGDGFNGHVGTPFIDVDGGSLSSGEDFQPLLGNTPQTSNCVNSFIAVGATTPTSSQRVGIRVNGDTLDWENDDVVATLTTSTPSFDVHTPTVTHRILNDDTSIAFVNSTVDGPEGGRAKITVKFAVNIHKPVTIPLRVRSGTATAGSDYDDSNLTMKFDADESERYLFIDLFDDNEFDSGESVVIEFDTNNLPTGLEVSTTPTQYDRTTVNIVDNDYEITVRGNKIVNEFEEAAVIEVNIDPAQPRTVGVEATFIDLDGNSGVATAGVDYQPYWGNTSLNPRVLLFKPGETSKALVIPIVTDDTDEDNEVFKVTLTQTGGATQIPSPTVNVIIREPLTNDRLSGVSIVRSGPATVREGQNAEFKLTMKPPAQSASTVLVLLQYKTDGLVVNWGSAASHMAVDFAANESEKTLIVPIPQDGRDTDGTLEALVLSPMLNAMGMMPASQGPWHSHGSRSGADVRIRNNPGLAMSAPPIPVPIAAVSNLQVTAVDAASASVTWDAVPHATSYEVAWDAESSEETFVSGILPSLTGTTATIQHNAEEPMTLTVMVTPEYVDGNGVTQQLGGLSATATLAVGPGGTQSDSSGDSSEPGSAQSTDSQAAACISDALRADVQDYAGETWRTSPGHVERWSRVLAAFGDSNGYSNNPMTVAEAQAQADRGLQRWVPVAAALECLETPPQEKEKEEEEAQPATLASPELSLSAGAAVNEGGNASFTITADPAPQSDLTIAYTVAQSGEYLDAPGAGSRTVTLAAGTASLTFSVATVDDAAAEADGSVSVTLGTGTGYTVAASPDNAATVAVADNDATSSAPTFSVGDETANENGGMMYFTVRLNRAVQRTVKVTVMARESTPVSARHGEDWYWWWPDGIVLTFYPGQTEKKTQVYVYNDSHDEDPETFEVVLTNPTNGAVIGDGVGVGTIVNSDPMPAAWLGRFGRTVSHQVVEGIQDRFTAPPPPPGLHLTVAGEELTSATPLAENQQVLAKVLGFETVTAQQAVEGSAFSFSPSADGHPVRFAIWGQGALSSFSGAEDNVSLDGDVTTALLGAEWSGARWQAGAALSHSWGSGGYAEDNTDTTEDTIVADGDITTTLTGIFPYGRYGLTPRLGIWAVAGYGWGDLTLKPDGDGTDYSPGITMTMGAVGMDGLLRDGGAEGLSLTSTADALLVKTTSEDGGGWPRLL